MGMRTVDQELSERDELVTTGEAARLLGASRQHVVDLCERGDLPFTTTGSHRRVRRSDVEAVRTRTERMTRDQRRSLWLGYAIAGKLATDATGTLLDKARRNLEHLRRIHSRGQAALWLTEWARLFAGPEQDVLEALTSPTPRARELRQNSPFAGILTEQERHLVLSRFGESGRRTRT